MILAACDGASPVDQPVKASPQTAVDDGRIACAIGAGAQWTRDCTVERSAATLTLRHPGGGFRRLHIVTDGRGVVPADGAEAAQVVIAGDRSIEVSVGDDRYRLPATVAASPR